MNPRSLPLSGLVSLRNARTRIFVPGSDPVFQPRETVRARRARMLGSFAVDTPRLFRADLLDRLQPSLTRRPE